MGKPIYLCIYTYTVSFFVQYMCMHILLHTSTYFYILLHTSTYFYIFSYVYIYFTFLSVHIYIYIHIRIYISKCIYVYIHTYTSRYTQDIFMCASLNTGMKSSRKLPCRQISHSAPMMVMPSHMISIRWLNDSKMGLKTDEFEGILSTAIFFFY